MKFTFDRDAMIKEVAIAQEIISTKNAGSILSNIAISVENNTLYMKATDIKVNFACQIPVQVEEEGSTTIYCDKFMSILTTLPEGEIEFIQGMDEGEQSIAVTIKPVAKKVKFQMKSISQEKYPAFEVGEGASYFEIPSKDLKEMISKTTFSVSTDETRYFMNGVYFEKKGDNLNLVSTDGRRLSFISKNLLAGVDDFAPALVHPKILNIISKRAPEEGNICVSVAEKMIFFKFGSYNFASVLLEGQFPNYERVIPQNQEKSFEVDKSDLVGALKRVALMVDKKAGRIYFTVRDGVLKITSPQSDMGNADEEIPCRYAGEESTIAVNYRHIEEPLHCIDTERVTFEFTEEMKAVTMRCEPAADYFFIIMPMQKE